MRPIIVCILAVLGARAWSVSLDSLFPPEVLAELEASGEVKRAFSGSDGLSLFPALPMYDRANRKIEELGPTIGVEFLGSYTPAVGPAGGDAETIYWALHSISTLKGIEYYSVSRGRVHTFFYDAAFVDSADVRVRLPDPVPARYAPRTDPGPDTVAASGSVAALPGSSRDIERRYAYFEDASLGSYVVGVTYENQPDYFMLSLENVSPIKKMAIRFVRPGDLISSIVVIPLKDRIVFYGFSCVRALNLFGVVERKGEDSLTNRLMALSNWFRGTYESFYGQ